MVGYLNGSENFLGELDIFHLLAIHATFFYHFVTHSMIISFHSNFMCQLRLLLPSPLGLGFNVSQTSSWMPHHHFCIKSMYYKSQREGDKSGLDCTANLIHRILSAVYIANTHTHMTHSLGIWRKLLSHYNSYHYRQPGSMFSRGDQYYNRPQERVRAVVYAHGRRRFLG